MGFLIAVDGVDSSGKQTQTELLYERLKERGNKVRKVSFPAYDSPSSSLVKMYLAGEFGTDPGDVNAYTASAFFALDRFATYKTDWGDDYNNDTIILADRYTTSNMIHQAGKISQPAEKERFIEWLYDFEYHICGLPKPDITVFLDMPPEYGIKLMENRANKINGSDVKDIHERSPEYLKSSYDNAVFIAEHYGWTRIPCAENNRVRTIDDINGDVFSAVVNALKAKNS